jgi:hypothetical protein
VDKITAAKFGKVTTTWLSTLFHFLSTINNYEGALVLAGYPRWWNKTGRDKNSGNYIQ